MKTALIACLVLLSPAAPQNTHLAEPPQEFVLQGNGKELPLRIGQPVELPKEWSGQKVTLRVLPTRLFDYQGLRFRYPQGYAWAYEQKEGGEQFVTLSGRTNVVSLQFFEDQQDPAQALERLARTQAAELGSRTTTSTSELAGKEKRKLAGKRLEVLSAGVKQTREVYALKLGAEVVLIVVQDTCGEDGKADPETTALLAGFADSLEWPK